jgi:MYXO-CTERM domain-containing protein
MTAARAAADKEARVSHQRRRLRWTLTVTERCLRILVVAAALLATLLLARPARAGMVTISPATASVPPNGTQMFTASGGSGMGYVWSLPNAPSGGSISGSGMYTAGAIGNTVDQVLVVDSAANMATAVVNVGGGVNIMPPSATLAPGDMQMFKGTGGKGPFTWTLTVSGSGPAASITAAGLYTAGASVGTDKILLTDSLGSSIGATIDVVAMVPIGTACTGSGTCPAGSDGAKHCVDGICCKTACSGQCEACNTSSSVGTCVTITGPPVGTRSACAMSDPMNVCSAKTCDGTSATACTSFVGAGVMCATATCVDLIGSPASLCNGDGGCPPIVKSTCSPFACVASACATSCTNTSECSPGNYCDVTMGMCVTAPDSGVIGGQPEGPAAAPPKSSGCAVGGEDASGSQSMVFALLGLVAMRKRRRQAAARPPPTAS